VNCESINQRHVREWKYGYHSEYAKACTRTGVTYNPKLAMNDGYCSMVNPGVTSKSVIIIPKFKSGNESLQGQYDEYFNLLYLHEMGHYEIYKRIIPEIDKEFKSIKKSKDCAIIQAKVNEIIEKYLAPNGILATQNAEYDK
jgi:predicted secreted Zn-dependent protease